MGHPDLSFSCTLALFLCFPLSLSLTHTQLLYFSLSLSCSPPLFILSSPCSLSSLSFFFFSFPRSSQTRPTCHNQLAVKADGEMRSPLDRTTTATVPRRRRPFPPIPRRRRRGHGDAARHRDADGKRDWRAVPATGGGGYASIIRFRETHSAVFARFQ